MTRRTYKISAITVNGFIMTKVIIDSHYEVKHGGYMSDELVLELVRKLDGLDEPPEVEIGQYSYFRILIKHGGRQFRLIWLLDDHAEFIGVVNVYRDDRRR